MDRTEQAMRFLTALALGRPGNEIRLHRASLDEIGPQHHLDCFMDGPLVVIQVTVDKATDTSSERKVADA
jgi:hypothetical protein